MNKKQLICLWSGIIVIVMMGIFPPWFLPLNVGRLQSRRDVGYKFILTPVEIEVPPAVDTSPVVASIDITRLCVQWVIVTVITGGFIVTFRDKKDRKLKDKQKE